MLVNGEYSGWQFSTNCSHGERKGERKMGFHETLRMLLSLTDVDLEQVFTDVRQWIRMIDL